MTPEALIYDRLSNAASLTALVDARIWPGLARQGCILPYVTYQPLGARPEYTHDGPEDWRETPVQIDCYGSTFDSARAVAAAVVAACFAADSPVAGEWLIVDNDGVSSFEEDTRLHRCMVEVSAWYRP